MSYRTAAEVRSRVLALLDMEEEDFAWERDFVEKLVTKIHELQEEEWEKLGESDIGPQIQMWFNAAVDKLNSGAQKLPMPEEFVEGIEISVSTKDMLEELNPSPTKRLTEILALEYPKITWKQFKERYGTEFKDVLSESTICGKFYDVYRIMKILDKAGRLK